MAGTEYVEKEKFTLEQMHEIIFKSASDTISVDVSTAEFILNGLLNNILNTLQPVTCPKLCGNTLQNFSNTQNIFCQV